MNKKIGQVTFIFNLRNQFSFKYDRFLLQNKIYNSCRYSQKIFVTTESVLSYEASILPLAKDFMADEKFTWPNIMTMEPR